MVTTRRSAAQIKAEDKLFLDGQVWDVPSVWKPLPTKTSMRLYNTLGEEVSKVYTDRHILDVVVKL